MSAEEKDGLKVLKSNKKNENKVWVSQRVSELGEGGILYPRVGSERHPYTREVLLLAELQGYKQEEMGSLCGVSQSQISQWMDGQSKASTEQLRLLINALSPLAPGENFHVKTIVTKTYVSLPDDWELKMLRGYLEKKLPYNSGFTLDSIREMAVAGVKSQAEGDLSQLRQSYKQENQSRRDQLINLAARKQDCEAELEKGANAKEEWERERKSYLDSSPELQELSDENKESHLDKQYPKPAVTNEEELEYISVLNELCVQYAVDTELAPTQKNEELEKIIEANIDQSQKDYEIEKNSLDAHWEEEGTKKDIFNKYDKSVDVSMLEIDGGTRNVAEEQIQIHAERLYANQEYQLISEEDQDWDDREVDINLDMVEVFSAYFRTLPVSIEKEEVQLCGAKLVEGVFLKGQKEFVNSVNESVDRVISSVGHGGVDRCEVTDTYGLECYQLFGKRLALECGYTEKKESEGEELTYIYIFDSLDKFLDKLTELLEEVEIYSRHNSTGEKLLKEPEKEKVYGHFKKSLLENGYRLDSVRSIY